CSPPAVGRRTKSQPCRLFCCRWAWFHWIYQALACRRQLQRWLCRRMLVAQLPCLESLPAGRAQAPAATPFRRGPACVLSAVGRWLGIPADTSTRHSSRRRRARASATRPASAFCAGLAGGTKRPGRQIWLQLEPALLCSVLSFSVAMTPVPFLPVPPAPDRRKVLAGARLSNFPKPREPKLTLTKKMTLTKMVLKRTRAADSTLE